MINDTAFNNDSREILALLRLLEDPDPFIQQQVNKRLSDFGEKVIPLIDEVRSKEGNSAQKNRLERLVHELSEGHFELEIAERINSGIDTLTDLENAMFILSKFHDTTLDIQPFRQYLNELAKKVHNHLASVDGERERVEAYLHYMFNQSGFSGRLDEYHNPDNSFIHTVMQQKTGLPLALAMVVLFVARRVGLNLQGMNMPIHFMIMYRMERQTLFIDPFGEGQLATYDQCYYFLKQNGVTPRADHFRPAAPKDMFARSLRNLVFSYQKQHEDAKAKQMQTILNMVELDPMKVMTTFE